MISLLLYLVFGLVIKNYLKYYFLQLTCCLLFNVTNNFNVNWIYSNLHSANEILYYKVC